MRKLSVKNKKKLKILAKQKKIKIIKKKSNREKKTIRGEIIKKFIL